MIGKRLRLSQDAYPHRPPPPPLPLAAPSPFESFLPSKPLAIEGQRGQCLTPVACERAPPSHYCVLHRLDVDRLPLLWSTHVIVQDHGGRQHVLL